VRWLKLWTQKTQRSLGRVPAERSVSSNPGDRGRAFRAPRGFLEGDTSAEPDGRDIAGCRLWREGQRKKGLWGTRCTQGFFGRKRGSISGFCRNPISVCGEGPPGRGPSKAEELRVIGDEDFPKGPGPRFRDLQSQRGYPEITGGGKASYSGPRDPLEERL